MTARTARTAKTVKTAKTAKSGRTGTGGKTARPAKAGTTNEAGTGGKTARPAKAGTKRPVEADDAAGRPNGAGARSARALRAESRLVLGVQRLRVEASRGLGERVLLVVGGVLAPLGVLLVLFGWAGASRTPNLYEQIPYLISGGLLGLGFMVLGGLLYFAYWSAGLLREVRAQGEQLDRLARALGAGDADGDAPATPAPAATNDEARPARGKGA